MCVHSGILYYRRQNSFCLSFYVHNKSGDILNVTCSYGTGKCDAISCHVTIMWCYVTGEEGKPPQHYVVRLRPKQKERIEMILLRFNLTESPAINQVTYMYIVHIPV